MWLHAPLLCCSVYCLQVAFRRGSARSYDHAQLVHRMWLHAAVERLDTHVVRVATDDNLADLPSRQVQILLLKNVSLLCTLFSMKGVLRVALMRRSQNEAGAGARRPSA